MNVRWSALALPDMPIRMSLFPRRMKPPARMLIKSSSCVESGNDLFTDNSRYFLYAFMAAWHAIDTLHHPSGIFMTYSIGTILGIDKTEMMRIVGLMTTTS